MSTADEQFVLVKRGPFHEAGFPAPLESVVRVYLGQRRADEDLALLSVTDPAGTYQVISVEYIDN